MKHKFGIDFDGVISDSRVVKQQIIQDKFGVKIPLDITGHETIIKHGLISNEQYQEMATLMYESEMVMKTEPVTGAIETIEVLRQSFDITIVTSRTQIGVDLAKRWCEINGLKGIEMVGTNRQEKIQALEGFEYFIDDSLKKLIPLIGKVPNLYLFSWPYNADQEVPIEITRAWSWEELLFHLF